MRFAWKAQFATKRIVQIPTYMPVMQAFARLRDHEGPFRKQSEAASRGSAPRLGQSLKPYFESASLIAC